MRLTILAFAHLPTKVTVFSPSFLSPFFYPAPWSYAMLQHNLSIRYYIHHICLSFDQTIIPSAGPNIYAFLNLMRALEGYTPFPLSILTIPLIPTLEKRTSIHSLFLSTQTGYISIHACLRSLIPDSLKTTPLFINAQTRHIHLFNIMAASSHCFHLHDHHLLQLFFTDREASIQIRLA